MQDDSKTVDEAIRQLTICNACRYCEDYCAVFPAIELRRVITEGDIEYLANLCHDCRDCLYACQYAPPHEFGVNLPRVLSQAREESYARHASGQGFGAKVRGVAATRATLGMTGLALLLGLAFVDVRRGFSSLAMAHLGPGAFYRVLPELLLEIVFGALGLFWLGRWVVSSRSFGGSRTNRPAAGPVLADFWTALGHSIRLTYLSGAGDGCQYPDANFSQTRRWLHQAVVAGFTLDLASTMLAALYDHVFGVKAPYPVLNPVVLLGAIGGLGLIAGTAGLLWQRRTADPSATTVSTRQAAQAFTANLLLVAVTGMLLLSVRSTGVMPVVLVLHLATVATLFVTAPYGKFVHAVLRYAALVRFAGEQRKDEAFNASPDQGHAYPPTSTMMIATDWGDTPRQG